MRLVQVSGAAMAVLFEIALTGCDSAPEEVGVHAEALHDAPLDPGHLFAVGVCTGPLNADGSCPVAGTANTSRCSGTLVAPNLVLTARHCVERPGGLEDDSDFCSANFSGVEINSSVSITAKDSVLQPGGTWYQVQRIDKPAGRAVCNDDIALLTLEANVRGVPLAAVDLIRNVAQVPPQEVAIVGRGWVKQSFDPDTHELIGFDNGGLLRRKLEHIPFVCASDDDDGCSLFNWVSETPIDHFRAGQLAYGRGGAPGDSGAGIYAQDLFEVGTFRVIAVHQTSISGPDAPDSNGGHGTRVDRHAPFIRRVAEQAARQGGYPLPSWATER